MWSPSTATCLHFVLTVNRCPSYETVQKPARPRGEARDRHIPQPELHLLVTRLLPINTKDQTAAFTLYAYFNL